MKKYLSAISSIFIIGLFVLPVTTVAVVSELTKEELFQVMDPFLGEYWDTHEIGLSFGFDPTENGKAEYVEDPDGSMIKLYTTATFDPEEVFSETADITFTFIKSSEGWVLFDSDFDEVADAFIAKRDGLVAARNEPPAEAEPLSDAEVKAIAGGLFGFGLALFLPFIIAILLGILGTIFWIWMLVDVIRRPNPDKALWVIIVLLFHVLGAIVYYFAERKKLMAQNPPVAAQAAPTTSIASVVPPSDSVPPTTTA